MRILCRHGHYAFYPRNEIEVFIYNDLYGAELVREDDYYTFPFLKGASDHSLVGKTYLGLPANARYEGKPWEIMKENNFVYSLALKVVVPVELILDFTDPYLAGQYFLSDALLVQAGAKNILGQRILSYDAEFLQEYNQIRILGMSYE